MDLDVKVKKNRLTCCMLACTFRTSTIIFFKEDGMEIRFNPVIHDERQAVLRLLETYSTKYAELNAEKIDVLENAAPTKEDAPELGKARTIDALIPWDERIHHEDRTLTKAGLWKAKSKVEKDYLEKVENELAGASPDQPDLAHTGSQPAAASLGGASAVTSGSTFPFPHGGASISGSKASNGPAAQDVLNAVAELAAEGADAEDINALLSGSGVPDISLVGTVDPQVRQAFIAATPVLSLLTKAAKKGVNAESINAFLMGYGVQGLAEVPIHQDKIQDIRTALETWLNGQQ